MSYCGKCGSYIHDDDLFCTKCGTPKQNVPSSPSSKRVEVKEGPVHKCPGCGGIIDVFGTRCSLCGYEFKSSEKDESVADLKLKLEQINKTVKRKQPSNSTSIANYDISSVFGSNYDETSSRRASVISSFKIPNDKEEIIAFMLLAASNIKPNYVAGNVWGNEISNSNRVKVEQNAWYAKLEEAYNKAKIVLRDDPDVIKTDKLYLDVKNKVLKEQKKHSVGFVLLMGLPIAMLIGMVVFYIVFYNSYYA